jgi:PBSX family phage terminase large subunit
MEGKHTYYDLYGGRGSTKSSFIGTMIPLGLMSDPNANAVIFRKVGNTIGTSVYEQILWSLNALGVMDEWKCTTSPYKITYRKTGQVILFRGLDKAKKMKSIKVSQGYLKYLWLNLLTTLNPLNSGKPLAIGQS